MKRKQREPATLTNRELMIEYYKADMAYKYSLVQEMTKRLGWTMITNDVVPVFSQYKLNGAGDQYK